MAMEKTNIKMRELYKNIESELDKVKYDNLWSGFFRMEFAIYNKTTVFLKDGEIPYDERFLGNTSINYHGKNLAIYYVERPSKENIQQLASLVVHEMFHSYQTLHGEKRFTKDLVGLNYPNDLKNYQVKYRENKLIVDAFNSRDMNTKLDILKEIIALRMSRLARYGSIIKYEMAIETIEGSAEYCGTKALKDISEKDYKKRIKDYKNILLNDFHLLFNIRKISYYTGTLFLLLLDDLKIPFSQEINKQSQYIFEEVAGKFKYKIINIDNIEETELEKHFIKHMDKINTKFKDFFKGHVKKHKGDFRICGYDPMNMIRQDDDILCSHFIMLIDDSTKEELFLKGPVMVKLKAGSYNQVIEYYLQD